MLAFPFVALALRRVWLVVRNPSQAGKVDAPPERGCGLAVIVASSLFVAAPAISDAGERLRAAHRWAATVWLVDGQARLAKWRRHGEARGPSPVSGAPNGVRLAAASAADPTEAEVVLASLPPGRYRLEGDVEGFDLAAGEVIRVELATETGAPTPIASAVVSAGEPAPDSATSARSRLQGDFVHAGGPLVLRARIAMEGTSGAAATTTPTRLAGAWISPVKLTTEVASP